MNDYTSDNAEGGGEGGLDMEVLHDFGEGVGVDMRDFGHGHVKEDSGGRSYTLKDTDDKEHEMSTPLLQQNPVMPHLNVPSSSIPVVSVDDIFQTETGMDGGDDDDDDEGMLYLIFLRIARRRVESRRSSSDMD